MNRRQFVKQAGVAAGIAAFGVPQLQTKHAIWIVNGGSRKMDWYGNVDLSPNLAQLAKEGFVYEESHNDSVSHHGFAWTELLTGVEHRSSDFKYPTLIEYLQRAYKDSSTNYWLSGDVRSETITRTLQDHKPRLIIWRQTTHDVGHRDDGYLQYLEACRNTDMQAGALAHFIKTDPYFSTNTAIIIRPEFGRDDVVNQHGALHHSEGFYQTHRSAEIWWGPDFKPGVCRTVKNRRDFVPSLTALFNVDATYAEGHVHREMFGATIMS